MPCLFYIFSSIGIDKSLIMHLSVGTSFAIIVPTAMMSVYTHYKHIAVDLNILKNYGTFVVIGVVIGSFLAALMNTISLVLFFIGLSDYAYMDAIELSIGQRRLHSLGRAMAKQPKILLKDEPAAG